MLVLHFDLSFYVCNFPYSSCYIATKQPSVLKIELILKLFKMMYFDCIKIEVCLWFSYIKKSIDTLARSILFDIMN